MGRLDGKIAAVTGGGSGIGEATCIRLAEDGARIAVIDLDVGAAALTAKLAGGGLAVAADVSESAQVDAALASIESDLGPVDIWVNNAGISGGAHSDRVNPRAEQQLAQLAAGEEVTTALEATAGMSDEEWRQMLSVHLDGTFYGTRAAARSMVKRGSGSILNVASICGIEGCTGHPHYSAAKAGVLGFTRATAKEVIVQGIRVNALAPGFIDTTRTKAQVGVAREVNVQRTPIGRLGTPEEIAAAVAFLVSDEASFFVGATVSPNGGIVTAV